MHKLQASKSVELTLYSMRILGKLYLYSYEYKKGI